jgi:hypothetical protein
MVVSSVVRVRLVGFEPSLIMAQQQAHLKPERKKGIV